MINAIRGTKDTLPEETPEWIFIENQARELFDLFGYQEIRTPIFERTELFVRSIGDATDIVEKEMYSFTDQGNRSLTLRPEATAPVVRAILEHHFFSKGPLHKLYYIGPMFRQERPQSGRQRQFHQLGIEFLGTEHPSSDAETIILLYAFLSRIGLGDATISINSVGCADCKKKFSALLRENLSENRENLCDLCQNRFSRNVFRILDCKRESCQEIVEKAPSLIDHLCDGCKTHFDRVQTFLTKSNTPFTCNPLLVRGLDYYTRTVFEVSHSQLGAKDALAAGGRYDNLIHSMGGPNVGAVGFGIGFERLLLARKEHERIVGKQPFVFLVSLDEQSFNENFTLYQELLGSSIKATLDPDQKSMKSQMRKANKLQCPYCLIRGEDELNNDTIIVKNMETSEEETLKTKSVVTYIQKLQKG